LKVENLQKNSIALTKISDALKIELETSLIQTEELQKDITSLKKQLAESLDKSKTLEKDLAILEQNYKSLYDSFLDYQKEAEKLLAIERIKSKTAMTFVWISSIIALVFGGLWGFKHFLTKWGIPMANPAVVSCAKDVWTKVATNVTSGAIYNMTPQVEFMQTYRTTGQSAPSGNTEAVPAFIYKHEPLSISAPAAIDVYLMPVGVAGSVRVDLWYSRDALFRG
jgi:hypothetical protein